MEKIKTNYRYVIDIIGTDPFFLEKLGVCVNLEKLEKMRYFQLTNG